MGWKEWRYDQEELLEKWEQEDEGGDDDAITD